MRLWAPEPRGLRPGGTALLTDVPLQGKLAMHVNDHDPTIMSRNFAILLLLLKARRGVGRGGGAAGCVNR